MTLFGPLNALVNDSAREENAVKKISNENFGC